MPLYINNNKVTKVFMGNNECKQIYYNGDKVFELLQPIRYDFSSPTSINFSVPVGYTILDWTVFIDAADSGEFVIQRGVDWPPVVTEQFNPGNEQRTGRISILAGEQYTVYFNMHGYYNIADAIIILYP